MDIDDLFVCFSNKAKTLPVGAPAFHEQIKDFAANLTEESLNYIPEFCT